MIPDTAVGATFAFTPTIDGGDGQVLTFAAANLPDGLIIDAATGEISGTPTTEGDVVIDVSVTGDPAGMGMTTCEFSVNPRLAATPIEAVPYCVRPGAENLKDLIVPGTGTGDLDAIRCFHDGRNGDGLLPAGISVDEETCDIVGNIEDTRYGTWVFIVRGEQDGASVWVPYCVTQDQETGYDILVQHSMLEDDGIDGTLIPIQRTFNPTAAINFGQDMDPFFEITDDDSCGSNVCFFGFAFNFDLGSQFDLSTFSLGPNPPLVLDENSGEPIGFSHILTLSRPNAVDEAFRDRPWTQNVELDYCIADTEGDPDDDTDGPCDGAANIRANGEGKFMVSILMNPQ